MVLTVLDERRQYFQPQIFHIADAEGTPLNHPNLVIESFHKSQRDFVVRMTVADDALPMSLHHLGELEVRRHAAPLELCLPVLEELLGPSGILIIPELTERFLEQICLADAFVGLEQEFQGSASFQIEIRFMRQERIALSLDKTPIFLGHPPVFPAPDLIQGVAQMPHDMKLVKDDPGLRSVARQRVSERRPHVHDREPQRPAALEPHIVEEPVHVFFGAPQLQAHPDRPLLIEIGHHNGVAVTFADRNLIDPDGPQPQGGQMLAPELAHVGDIHAPHLVPAEPVTFSNFLDRHCPAIFPDHPFEAFGETPGFGQPSQRFLPHHVTAPTLDPAVLEFQVDPRATRIQVTHPVDAPVVETAYRAAA